MAKLLPNSGFPREMSSAYSLFKEKVSFKKKWKRTNTWEISIMLSSLKTMSVCKWIYGILSVVFGNIRLRMGAGKNEREISSWALHPVTPRVGQEVWAEMGWPEGQRETAPPGKCLCPSAQAWPHVNRAGNSQMGPLLSHHPMVAVTILLESLLVSSRSSVGCFFIS